MNGESYRARGELEGAHQEENRIAQQRVERADEYVSYYRSRMTLMQETLYEVAARRGAADDEGFRAEFQRVTNEVDENVRAASRVVERLEVDYRDGLARQSEELENLRSEWSGAY